MVEALCDINPTLKEFIIKTWNKIKLMYGQLNKAVYGTLLGAILFYEKLGGKLIKWG